MPVLENLKKICKEEQFNPELPSWCVVNYLLLKNEGEENIHPGAVVAASAECSLFSYNPESVAPMYFNTIGGNERLKLVTGYRIEGIRTDNAAEAFLFIKKGIDKAKGVFVSGPEMGLCYGYEDNQNINNRIVYGIAQWGPGFHGEFLWEKFTRFVQIFGNNEGFATVNFEKKPAEKEKIIEMMAVNVIDWQENHPALKYGQKKEFYGLEAFQRFISDLSDPETRKTIDEAYINCHAILFQMGGRYWLGLYLKEIAELFSEENKNIVSEIGSLYFKSYEKMKQFSDYDILSNKNEDEITTAISWLKDAYEFEKI